MIRGSVVVAAVAILVSLLVHILGLSMTAPDKSVAPVAQGDADVVDLGNSFEDLAEAPANPVEPEAAEITEPEEAENPTGQALVASENPERVLAPDFGKAEIVQPDVIEPRDAEPADPSDSDQPSRADAENTQPEATDTIAEVPQGEPATETEPVEAEVPTPPIISALEPEDEAESLVPEQVVTEPVRSRLPDRDPSEAPDGAADSTDVFADLRFPQQFIESPLTTFQRRGTDVFMRGDQQRQSGGRGPGNSKETNYAGLVLVHLNRTITVYASARGFAQVFFQIDPDGSLAWVEITDSSGSTEINRAAKQQVRNAVPFPPPPDGVSRKLSFYFRNNR